MWQKNGFWQHFETQIFSLHICLCTPKNIAFLQWCGAGANIYLSKTLGKSLYRDFISITGNVDLADILHSEGGFTASSLPVTGSTLHARQRQKCNFVNFMSLLLFWCSTWPPDHKTFRILIVGPL